MVVLKEITQKKDGILALEMVFSVFERSRDFPKAAGLGKTGRESWEGGDFQVGSPLAEGPECASIFPKVESSSRDIFSAAPFTASLSVAA